MITYNLSFSNLLPTDILPNEDKFRDTERVSARIKIPIKYRNKPDSYIHLDLLFLPCGQKTIEELLLENIPLYLSEKQRKIYKKNGAICLHLWSNRKWKNIIKIILRSELMRTIALQFANWCIGEGFTSNATAKDYEQFLKERYKI